MPEELRRELVSRAGTFDPQEAAEKFEHLLTFPSCDHVDVTSPRVMHLFAPLNGEWLRMRCEGCLSDVLQRVLRKMQEMGLTDVPPFRCRLCRQPTHQTAHFEFPPCTARRKGASRRWPRVRSSSRSRSARSASWRSEAAAKGRTKRDPPPAPSIPEQRRNRNELTGRLVRPR